MFNLVTLFNVIHQHPSERFTFYSTAYSTIHARSLAEIPSAGTSLSEMLKAGCWWIDILAPTDSEVQDLGRVCIAFWNYFFFFFLQLILMVLVYD